MTAPRSRLPFAYRYTGTETAIMLRNASAADQSPLVIEIQVTAAGAVLAADVGVAVNDFIEIPSNRRRPSQLKIVTAVNRQPEVVHIQWTDAPDRAVQRSGVVEMSVLHPEVATAARSLFESGHFAQAIFEALKALEGRVQAQSGLAEFGVDLMRRVFRAKEPLIDVGVESGSSGDAEREGFGHIFAGVSQGIRNPKAHGLIRQDDPVRAMEYLALVGLLFRRLDDALTSNADPSADVGERDGVVVEPPDTGDDDSTGGDDA